MRTANCPTCRISFEFTSGTCVHASCDEGDNGADDDGGGGGGRGDGVGGGGEGADVEGDNGFTG